MFQALADEAIARAALNDPNFSIQSTIAPLPVTKLEETIGKGEDAFLAWFLVVLSFPFIAGAFASFIVVERESKAKHLQTVAGVEPAAYWISTMLWDIMNYQIPFCITIILMYAFDVNVLTTTDGNVITGIIALLFFYGPASAAFAYVISFAFKSPSLCTVCIIVTGFLIGMGGPLTIFILLIIGEDQSDPKPNLVRVAKILKWSLRWIPTFCLGNGIFGAINLPLIRAFNEDQGLSAWSEEVLLAEVIFLAVEGLVYLGIAIIMDIGTSNPSVMAVLQSFFRIVTLQFLCANGDGGNDITRALDEDSDVLDEEQRVLNGAANTDHIVLSQLSKVYSNKKVAVNSMSLGIGHGECFGLLGINGAGKTTTMGMLTAGASTPPYFGAQLTIPHQSSPHPVAMQLSLALVLLENQKRYADALDIAPSSMHTLQI